MFRFPVILLMSIFVLSTPFSGILAQEELPEPIGLPSAAFGLLDTAVLPCFDYYKFGSVQADIQPTVTNVVSGTDLTFTGKVINDNPYPLVDGTLFVKIFKTDEDTFAAGDGNPVVDQFVIEEDITLTANGNVNLSYHWKIPRNIAAGEYYAAYFFVTSDRYNIMGLSFTDDVVGNTAAFTVMTEEGGELPVVFNKSETTINGQNHHFAAVPLHFPAEEQVVISTTISNPTEQQKTFPLQWKQYAWDGMNPDNVQHTETELVTLAPNETKTVVYTVKNQRESVVYITATLQDIEARSVLNIRYVQDGIEETRINFPGITTFPLQSGNEVTLFACAHSTNVPLVDGNTLTLELKDMNGTVIHSYIYEGAITGEMSGFGDSFTPSTNYDYVELVATLEREGVVVEEVQIVYDCTTIDSSTCFTEESYTPGMTSIQLILITVCTVILLLILIIMFVMFRKKGTQHLLSMFILISIGAFFVQASVVEAKTVQWSSAPTPTLTYCWNRDFNFTSNGGDVQSRNCTTQRSPLSTSQQLNWEQGLSNAVVSILYEATITNLDTGTQISDGATLPIGTRLQLRTKPHSSTDASWFGTGYSSDSPNGEWRTNATPPDWQTQSYVDPFGGAGRTKTGPVCNSKDYVGSVYLTSGLRSVNVHVPFVVSPTTNKTVSASSNLSCSAATIDANGTLTQTCTVSAAGTINISFRFPSTFGKFYYRYFDPGGTTNGFDYILQGCFGNQNALRTASSFSTIYPYTAVAFGALASSDYQVIVPEQTIPFTLSVAAPSNNPPNPPTITGPVTGNIGTAYTFSMVASDPDNDTLYYEIDWNNNGTVTGRAPGSGFVNSNTSQNQSRTWTTNGAKTFNVRAVDNKGAASAWRGHTITITTPPPPPPADCTWDSLSATDDFAGAGSNANMTCPATNCPASAVDGAPAPPGSPSSCLKSCSTSGTYRNTETMTKVGPGCAVAPLVPTVDLKHGASNGPVTVAKNSTLNLNWISSNVISCVAYGPNWNGAKAVTGTEPVLAMSGNYIIDCVTTSGNINDTLVVTVNNGAPNPPTIVGPTTAIGDVSNVFTITGTDPDNDAIYYELDRNNDGTAESPTTPATGFVPSGTARTWSNTWSGSGSYTFRARTVDSDGLRSTWASHTISISAPPTATLTPNQSPLDPGDNLQLTWTSTNATSCSGSGSGFDVSGPSGTDTSVTPPAPGTSGTYSVTCSGPGGNTTANTVVSVNALPNYTTPTVTFNEQNFSFVTGQYQTVTFTVASINNGGVAVPSGSTFLLDFGGVIPNVTGTLSAASIGSSASGVVNVPNVPFGPLPVTVTVDSADAVNEGNEGDNTATYTLTMPLLDPGISITADRIQVRNDETVNLSWDTVATFAMNCTVVGPNVGPITFDPSTSGPTGSTPSGAITAKSEFILTCVEPITNTSFTDSVIVETVGAIEET